MSAVRFTDVLRGKAATTWRRELEHPFVRGLASGALPIERFRFYLRQDYLFLIEYCRVFALAAAKARDLEHIRIFASLLHETLHTEMELHRDYCARLGIAAHQLERSEPAPVTHAYTRHLLNVAYGGALPEILAAVLPCQLGYAEIGAGLAREPNWQASAYAEWIRAYSSPEFVASAERLRAMLDELTAGWPPAALEPLEGHFLMSTRYEYLFWEMSWNESQWPL
ncbi:MAG: thiaminase II [Candidatus Binataceae bacterium]